MNYKNNLEKVYSIRGIAILSIIICHTPTIISNYCFSFLAVSVFFFFSSYFTVYNYLNKKDYLNNNYIIKKVKSIYIPFVISNIIYILIYSITNEKNCYDNIINLFLKIFGIIPINGCLWYIFHILVFYSIFYLFYKNNKKNTSINYYIITYIVYLLSILIIVEYFKIWAGFSFFEHRLLLIGGIYALIENKYKKYNLVEKTFFNNKKYITLFIIIYISLLVYGIISRNFLLAAIVEMFIPLLLIIIVKKNNILDYIGKNSLTLYLYHIQVIMLLNYYLKSNNDLIYILLFLLILSIFLLIYNIITNKIITLSNKLKLYSKQ